MASKQEQAAEFVAHSFRLTTSFDGSNSWAVTITIEYCSLTKIMPGDLFLEARTPIVKFWNNPGRWIQVMEKEIEKFYGTWVITGGPLPILEIG